MKLFRTLAMLGLLLGVSYPARHPVKSFKATFGNKVVRHVGRDVKSVLL